MSGEDEFCERLCHTPGMRYDTLDTCMSVCKGGEGCEMCGPATPCAGACAEHRKKACFWKERCPFPTHGALAATLTKPEKRNLMYGVAGIAIGVLATLVIVKARKSH